VSARDDRGAEALYRDRAQQQSWAELLSGNCLRDAEDPNREIFDIIRYFGSRGKIFNVHFRNIKGHVLDFAETLPDNGDVDMPRALRTYQEVGYDGMIMPDHVPVIEGDSKGALAYAYSFGYIQALLQIVQGAA